jgi:phosphonoacetaldehyde hydrolase
MGFEMSDGNPQSAQYHGKLKAVILDWAGTTVDYGSLAPVRTMQEVFARANLKVDEAEIRQHMGLPKKQHIGAILCSTQKVRDEWTRLRGCAPREADVEELYREFIPLQFSCLLGYSAVIPGVVEATERFRRRGLKIGTTTGYTREMLDLLVEASRKAGYVPDYNLAPGDVGSGRPYPYMIYENAVRLQVYPMAAIAKIGDTPADVEEGLNAGTWSIGVAATGNMIGLSYEEFQALPPPEREKRLVAARAELKKAGAHYVVDSLADLDPVLDDIDARLKSAEKP